MRLKILCVLEMIALAVFLMGCSEDGIGENVNGSNLENSSETEESVVTDTTEESVKDVYDEKANEDNTVEITTTITTETPTTEEALIVIPDLVGTDESVAQTVLLNNGLIPMVDYTYSDFVDIGKVVALSYEVGDEVPKNTNVTMYISKGKENYYCASYSVSWSNSNPNWSDSWNVTNAFIEGGVLHIWMSGNMIIVIPLLSQKYVNSESVVERLRRTE